MLAGRGPALEHVALYDAVRVRERVGKLVAGLKVVHVHGRVLVPQQLVHRSLDPNVSVRGMVDNGDCNRGPLGDSGGVLTHNAAQDSHEVLERVFQLFA